jgi:hypothetical protein
MQVLKCQICRIGCIGAKNLFLLLGHGIGGMGIGGTDNIYKIIGYGAGAWGTQV